MVNHKKAASAAFLIQEKISQHFFELGCGNFCGTIKLGMIINRKIIIISAAVVAGLAILAIGGIMLLNNQTTNKTEGPGVTNSPASGSPFELTLTIEPSTDIKIISATLKNISQEPHSYQSYYKPELKIVDSTGQDVPTVPSGLLIETRSRPPMKEDFKTLQPGETSSWSYVVESIQTSGLQGTNLQEFTIEPVDYTIKTQDDTIYLLKTGGKYQASVKWTSANVWNDVTGTGGYDAIIPAKSHVVPDAWVGVLEAKGLEFEL